jgi:hypothetical protein
VIVTFFGVHYGIGKHLLELLAVSSIANIEKAMMVVSFIPSEAIQLTHQLIVLVDIGSHVYCHNVPAEILHLPLPPADCLEELASIRALHHHGGYSRLLPLLWTFLTL